MQVLTRMPSSTFILPYFLHVSAISLRPINKSVTGRPCSSFNRPHCLLRNLYPFSLSLSFILQPFLASALKPVSPLPLRRTFKSGVPGRAQLSETVSFMTRWRVSLPYTGFKESGAFLRAKLKRHPSECMMSSFLTRPQSTLTPNCTFTPSTET